jgi:hypothetical protein
MAAYEWTVADTDDREVVLKMSTDCFYKTSSLPIHGWANSNMRVFMVSDKEIMVKCRESNQILRIKMGALEFIQKHKINLLFSE